MLHASVDSPQFLGELGVLGDLPRSADLVTLDDSDVWSAPGEDFIAFVTAQPSASRQLLAALARQIQEHQAFADDLLYLDLKGRVAKRLLQHERALISEMRDSRHHRRRGRYADLASLCGGAAERDPVLTELQRRGLVKRDSQRYVLKKPAQLARIAGL